MINSVNIRYDDMVLNADKIEPNSYSCAAKNNTISLYLNAKAVSDIESNTIIFTLPGEYRPNIAYAVSSVRSRLSPYKEIGTLWIERINGTAQIYLSETINAGTNFFIYAKWVY